MAHKNTQKVLMENNTNFSTPRVSQLINEIQIVPVHASHIEDIARLHFKLLSWSFNGQFGLDHMIEIYRALFNSQYTFGYVYYNFKKN